jgi:hypothetical protein
MSIPATHLLPASRRRRAAAWLVALALGWLLAQSVGLVHRTVHGGAAGPAVAVALVHGHAHADAPAAREAVPWFGSHEDGSAECRLVDQLSHADALPVVAWPMVAIAALPVPIRWVPAALARRHIGAFQARGPPRG